MRLRNLWLLGSSAAVVACALSAPAAYAQEVTTAVTGAISTSDGKPIANATIEITHVPTGTIRTLPVAESGRFSVSGLRPGGPYILKVSAQGYRTYQVTDLQLALNDTTSLNIALEPEAADAKNDIVVTASRAGLSSTRTGVGNTFSRGQIDSLPVVFRDPKEIVRLDPRAVVTNPSNPELSIAGLNQRYNAVTIDGIRLNDDFGLNRSGNPGLANPVSIDAIDQIAVKIADYDVEASQYIGGNVNIITKSGTNKFHGSGYLYFRNDKFAGDLPNGAKPNLKDTTWGGTLGGPIIKDRVFFFVNYEKFKTSTPTAYTPVSAGISTADITSFQNILKSTYGYDAGGVQASNTFNDERLLAKIDANITDGHRLVLTYSQDKATSSEQQNSSPSSFALSSDYFNRARDVKGYSAALYSTWTPQLSTELVYSHKEAFEDRNPSNDHFAEFVLSLPGGKTLYAGPNFPFQFNRASNAYDDFKAVVRYNIGEHSLKGGYEYQHFKLDNNFVLFAPNGYYTFASLADLAARTATGFTYENAASGNPADAGAHWGYSIHNVFLQDSWPLTDTLTVDYGVRAEFYSAGTLPKENPSFVTRNGFSNAQNLDGKSVIQPRLGLVWKPVPKLTVRAGAGLFSGGTPNVFYSNTFNRNGVASVAINALGQPCANLGAAAAAAICTNVDGSKVPAAAQALVAAGVGSGAAEALDPNFKVPSSWKFSASADYSFDLTRFGLGDGWQARADALFIKANNAITTRFLGITQTGNSTVDGRPLFKVGTADYLLTNTSLGRAVSLSASLNKQFDTGWTLFGAYTFTDSKDADSNLGSVLSDSTATVATDPNHLSLTRSAFEVRNRFILGATYKHAWFDKYETRIGLFGERRDGLPFSYIYANNPFGSLASAPFYLPLVNDPHVSYAAGTQQALDSFVAANGLEGYRGKIIPRNAFRAPPVTKVDLHFSQEIPGFFSGSKMELTFDINNLTNLINRDWGVERSVNSTGTFGPSAIALTSVAYNPATGMYTYSGTPQAGPSDPARIINTNSYWSMQIGLRFKF